jgi:hypothetical protein
VSFAARTVCVASQQVFIVVVYFVIDSVRKLLDTPSYLNTLSTSAVCCFACIFRKICKTIFFFFFLPLGSMTIFSYAIGNHEES